ncbi:MAG: hypothetical protein NZ960_07780 [Candidatus Kapabacteria bacterium]|nr:hypothetical protein [Candidatus Kapabacteria bacterium]MDW8011957.1 hypothetical protein [Bacteroidota bacterium]
MCAKPFLGDVPPYRLFVTCRGSVDEGVCVLLRLETRSAFRFAYALEVSGQTRLTDGGIPELYIQLQGIRLLTAGTKGDAPAVAHYSDCLPKGVERCYCTLELGRRSQRFLLRLLPPLAVLLQQSVVGAPIAELLP